MSQLDFMRISSDSLLEFSGKFSFLHFLPSNSKSFCPCENAVLGADKKKEHGQLLTPKTRSYFLTPCCPTVRFHS